jgi:hypothetical protein
MSFQDHLVEAMKDVREAHRSFFGPFSSHSSFILDCAHHNSLTDECFSRRWHPGLEW